MHPPSDDSVYFSINDFLVKQNQGLLQDFIKSGLCLVAASPKKMQELHADGEWIINDLPGCKASNACIIQKNGNFEPECWVRWDYRDYRKRAFKNYLKIYYPEFKEILSANFEVDHLQAKHRFNAGDPHFVRLHLVSKKINSSYGASYEKMFLKNERLKSPREADCMSWIGFCKAYGLPLPKKKSGIQKWEEWAQNNTIHLSSILNEPPHLIYSGLLDVLRLGYKGSYSGNKGVLSLTNEYLSF